MTTMNAIGTPVITLGGPLTFTGAFSFIGNLTGNTNVTFPTSGTLATTDIFPIFPLSLADGGTGKDITADLGAIVYCTGTNFDLLAHTTTANQVLLSGNAAAPIWSTTTYPVTTTINQILYSSAANTISGLATANNGVLVTSAGGVPSISSTLPNAVQDNIVRLGTVGTVAGTLNMSTHFITNVIDPVNPQDAATKNYVDTATAGLKVQPACSVGSTTAFTVTYSNGAAGVGATLTNAGAQVTLAIDGVSPSVNDRVLVKNQASTFQNGIYTVTNVGSGVSNWIMTRATNFDETTEIVPGAFVIVENGTVNANTSWIQTQTVAAIGTDPILFSQFSISPGLFLLKANNLSDVANALTSFNNISPLTTKGDVLTHDSTNNIRLGVGSDGQMLQASSGAGSGLAWSTATYPVTTTINRILFSSANNVVSQIVTVNSAGLLTSASGVPGFVAYTGTGAPVLATSPTLVTPTLGVASATSLAFTSTAGIIGTTTNNNAAAGSVGEFISSVVSFSGGGISLINGAITNVTTISLGAGDWDVWGNVFFDFSGGSALTSNCWTSLVSATLPDLSLISGVNGAISNAVGYPAPYQRYSLAAPATIYLTAVCHFSSGTAVASGGIYARRAR